MVEVFKNFGLCLLLLVVGFLRSGTSVIATAVDPTGAWSANTPLPYNLALHVSFSRNSKLYIAGGSAVTGQSHTQVISSISGLGGLLGVWDFSSSPMSTALIYHSGAQKDRFVYVLGGKEENVPPITSVNKVFLGIINDLGFIESWAQLNSLPVRVQLGVAIVVGNRLYFAGGNTYPEGTWNGNVYFADINADGTVGAWQIAGVLPEPNIGFGMIEHNGHLIVIGGYGQVSGYISKVFTAPIGTDGKIGGWVETSPLPESLNSGVLVVGTTVMTVGGGRPGGFLDKIYYADLNSDGSVGPWSLSANRLPQPLCCGALSMVNGYAYLTGGFGGSYLNTVYMSRLAITPTPTPSPTSTPTPTPTPLTPIILIPGMGASWNYEALVHGTIATDTDWKIAPYVKVYDGLISALEAAGYVRNSNLFVYAYDWRKNVSQTQQNLADFIVQKGLIKVNLIGHSLGGLVARAYAQANSDKVDKLLTAGSPHQGASQVYYLWEGVDSQGFPGWQKLAMKLLLRVNRSQYDTEVAEVQALFPALRNILPIYEFLKNIDGTIKPLSSMTWSNNFLPLGGDLSKLLTLSGNLGSTLKFIQIGPRSSADILIGRWVDGKPTSQKEDADGDGTVLLSSSQVSGALVNDELSGKNHAEIIAKEISQKKILQMLGLPLNGQDVDQPNYDNAIIVTTASPVNFQVSGPGGTFLPTDGIVVIDNPADNDYQVTVSPAGAGGNYTLYFGRIKGNDEAWEEVSDSVVSGQMDQFVFGVQLNQANLGDVPLDNAQTRLETLKTAINISPLGLIAKRIMLQDLSRIKSYVVDIGRPQVNTAAKFDTRMYQLYRTIDMLITKMGKGLWAGMTPDLQQQIKEELRLVKQDAYQQRGDKFGL